MKEEEIKQKIGGNLPLNNPEDADPIMPVVPPTKWDKEADVVVVGGGGGGLTGALKAVEKGNSVILLEKEEKTGGTSAYASAFYCYGSRVQKAAGVPFDEDKIVQKYLFETGYTANPHLLRKMIKKSGEVVDWLEDLGMEWEPEKGGYPALVPKDSYDRIAYTRAVDFIYFLVKVGKEKGVKTIVNTAASALVREKGRIVGVKTTNVLDGTTIFVKAKKGIVLAAGGMHYNLTMLKKYVPTAYKGVGSVSMCLPSNTGECIRMGLGVGADTAGFDSLIGFDGGIDLREVWRAVV